MDNKDAPSGAQMSNAGVTLDPENEDAGVELRLALSVREAWRARVDAAIDPLEDLRRQLQGRQLQDFGADHSDTLEELVDKLRESVRRRLREHADDTLTAEFVRESYTEVATIVANGLPNDVAAIRDVDELQRDIRGATAEFVQVAHARIVDERLLTIPRSLKSKEAKGGNELESKRRRRVGLLLRKGPRENAFGLPLPPGKADRDAAVKFAKSEVRQLINRLHQIAGDVETALVVHVVLAIRPTD